MLQNYIKITLRNLLKYKAFSIINLLGLTVGLASFLLIAIWIQDEKSYDQFHEFSDRLYLVLGNHAYSDGQIFTQAAAPGLLGKTLKEEIPEITYANTMDNWTNALLSFENKHLKEEGRYVSEDFLKMFTFPLVQGDKETALSSPNGIVISQTVADKFFPNANPIGKTLKVANRLEHQITGVMKDFPSNSIFDFEFLLPLGGFLERNAWARQWENNGLHTYVMLEENADVAAVNAKIKDIVVEHGAQENVELFLQALPDIYLKTDYKNGQYQGGGRITYVRLFGLIGLLLLAIAAINFMNLSSARATIRAKEVGIRKVVGAGRRILSLQFLGEAIIMCTIALGFALLMVQLVLPWFNNFTSKNIVFPFENPITWLVLGSIVLITGLLSGSYPAFIISAFQPSAVLKGQLTHSTKGVLLRKVLVISQFSIAVFLIMGMIVIQKQLNFLQTKNIGYDKEQLLLITMNNELRQKYPSLKTKLLNLPAISAVSASHSNPTSFMNASDNFSWEGKNPNESYSIVYETVKPDYISTIGAELLEGRDFSIEHPSDSMNFIINESSAKLMGLKAPIVGQQIENFSGKGQIVGVVKDFHFTSLKAPVEPLVLTMNSPFVWTLYARINSEQTSDVLRQAEKICKTYSPTSPFEYEFADAAYQKLYENEKIISQLSSLFAFLAIFISCLGLFGLATFTTERRIKEIGIRRVLGASVAGIVRLLSKDFLQPVFIALLLATPLAWHFMKTWLNDFAYHIHIEWWMFAMTGVLAVSVAFLTVGFQSIKAALSNPVDSLKNE